MQKGKNILKKIISWLLLILAIFALYKTFNIYKQKDYNNFVRAERNVYTSEFTRDKSVKYNDYASYKIQSNTFNDAMFYKTVQVEPNTPYKITCKVKTLDIEKQENNNGGGAQIAIENTTERSKVLSGTNDWTELTLYFNSKNRSEINIGFRLGGYDNMCTGTAWFSDFILEEGTEDNSNVWNMVCFILKNTDVYIDSKEYKFQIDDDEINLMEDDMKRFKNTCEEFSEGKMKVNYEIIQIEEPITSISYDQENEYYVNPTDVESIIQSYIESKEYDHIFVVVKLGDLTKNLEIPVNDWIGLGGMEYQNIGFSNIRLPNDKNSYMYRYNYYINRFPEEVFIHEFLHSLEKNSTEFGYSIPALHDSAKYGYESEMYISLKNWYRDYMQKKIYYQGNYIGLPEEIYSKKPVHESEFLYSRIIKVNDEPQNIIDEITNLAHNVLNVVMRIFSYSN